MKDAVGDLRQTTQWLIIMFTAQRLDCMHLYSASSYVDYTIVCCTHMYTYIYASRNHSVNAPRRPSKGQHGGSTMCSMETAARSTLALRSGVP